VAYPTVPHQWLQRFQDLPSGDDQDWFGRLADRVGVVESPADWTDRVGAWSQGLILAVGRVSRASPPRPQGLSRTSSAKPQGLAARISRLPAPDAPALVIVEGRHRVWAYSHRAVWSAGEAVASFGIGSTFGALAYVSWWNHWPWLENGHQFVPTACKIRGCVAFSDGLRTVYWHPRVLGPVLIEDENGKRLAPDLAGSIDEVNGVWLRGETVPIGRWTGTEVVPVSYPGGWWLGGDAVP